MVVGNIRSTRSGALALGLLATAACSDRATYRDAAAALPFRTNIPSQSEGLMARSGNPASTGSAVAPVASDACKEIFNGPVLVRDNVTATVAISAPVSIRVASLRFSNEPSYDRASLDLQVTFNGNDSRRIAVTRDEPRPALAYTGADGSKYTFTFSSDSAVRMPQGMFERDDIIGHAIRICVAEVPGEQKPPEPAPVAPAPAPRPEPRPAPRRPVSRAPAPVSAARGNCPSNNCGGITVTVSPVIVNGGGSVTRESVTGDSPARDAGVQGAGAQ